MDFLIAAAHAQGAPAQPDPWLQLLPLVVIVIVFYFLLIRPQMRRQKEHKAMIDALAKGDEVVTGGGIVGRIDELKEHFVIIEIAPGVRVPMQRHAITAVLPKGTIKAI